MVYWYAHGAKSTEVIRLTPLGASHTGLNNNNDLYKLKINFYFVEVTMSPDSALFVAKSSSVSSPPHTTIFTLRFENSSKFPTAVPVSRIASALPANPFPANPPNVFILLIFSSIFFFFFFFVLLSRQ